VNKKEYVILVDQSDTEIGSMEKLEAHEKGILHRAFSIFLLNSKGELLLQQRSEKKYHSPLKWTNTCCSHQRHGETTLDAAQRRLVEEMGISCPVRDAYTFLYKADVGDGLTEHELDHVLIGTWENENIPFNREEVQAMKFASIEWIEKEIKSNPDQFTKWFLITFNDFKKHLNGNSN
jgi:isopentenyl-diphosphate delta-isomerase